MNIFFASLMQTATILARRGYPRIGQYLLEQTSVREPAYHRLCTRLSAAVGWYEGTSGHKHLGPAFSPEVRASADAFFAHKAEHPEIIPYEQLTPLQKRMQDGFAYPEPLKK